MIKTPASRAMHGYGGWRVLLLAVALLAAGTGASNPIAAQSTATLTPGSGAPTPVYRWHNNADTDWVTIPAHGTQPSDASLIAEGYVKDNTAQYYVDMIGTNDPNMVAVYRWWNAADTDWVDIRDGSIPDATLTAWGYTNKTFQYYAYLTNGPGRVAVNRWWSAVDRDWITLRQDEIPDATLTAWGYTSKTFLVYAAGVQSPTGQVGYFTMDTPQSAVVPTSMVSGFYPHTMSVVDVNPALSPAVNHGYRYLGYFGHNECGNPPVQGIYIARSNDLNASTWQEDPTPPVFAGTPPCRWASAILDGTNVDLVVNQVWDQTITAQVSTDGPNGTAFGPATVLVSEPDYSDGNPTLFRDPNTGTFYLYWYRHSHAGGMYEIRVKSSSSFAGLLGSGPTDIGQLVAYSPEITAAPQIMYVNGKYYLAVETHEGDQVYTGCADGSDCIWRTRILTGVSPTGPFYEIPGNPLYGAGAACVFQHVVGTVLHSFYCENSPGASTPWTLNHVTADLLSPN